jgi:hypothetical protein
VGLLAKLFGPPQTVEGPDGYRLGIGEKVELAVSSPDSPVTVRVRITRIERDGTFWCRTPGGLIHFEFAGDGSWVIVPRRRRSGAAS